MSLQASKTRPGQLYTLLGPDRKPYPSQTPGRYGGYRPGKLYGRLCCVASTYGMLSRKLGRGSDGQGQLTERDGHPPGRRLPNAQLVVSAPNVLDERVPDDHDRGAAILLEPAHRP
jgi:hypothetical protein